MKKRIVLLTLIILVLFISSCVHYPSGKAIDDKISGPSPAAKYPEPKEEGSIETYSSGSSAKSPSTTSSSSNAQEIDEESLIEIEEPQEPVKPKKPGPKLYSPSLFNRLLDFFQTLFKPDLSPVGKVISNHEPNYIIHNSETDTIDITLTTYVSANCKYSYDENTLFEDMPYTFENTGLTHSADLTNLQPAHTYRIYARCNSSIGLTTNDYNITYRILPEINDLYPKLAMVRHPCITSQEEVEDLARYDLLVMHKRHSWDTLDCNTGQLEDLRELNPNIKILAHLPQSYIQYPSENWPGDNSYPQSDNIIYPLMEGITFYGTPTNRMILSDTQGNPILIQRAGWQEAISDITPLCPEGAEGTWNEQTINYTKEIILKSGVWDGIFWDSLYNSISWYNNYIDYPIDLNEDGVADSASWLDQQWAAGIDEFSNLAREQLGPDVLMVANGNQERYETYNGRMIESFRPWEWENDFGSLQEWEGSAKDPELNMVVKQFNEPVSNAYKGLRWGLGATLLSNAYYEAANNEYTESWWIDEFAVDFETGEAVSPSSENNWAGKGYLGEPINEAYTLGLTDTYHPFDVWRRDFENGTVIVNPNYYSSSPRYSYITIELEKEYRKISGTQDPVNNGFIVSNITLEWRDAIILLNTIEEGNTTRATLGGEGGAGGETGVLEGSSEETEEETNKEGFECSPIGEKRCINEKSYNLCESYIWSTPIDCTFGHICQDGECIPKKIDIIEVLNNPENRSMFWTLGGLFCLAGIVTIIFTRRLHRFKV